MTARANGITALIHGRPSCDSSDYDPRGMGSTVKLEPVPPTPRSAVALLERAASVGHNQAGSTRAMPLDYRIHHQLRLVLTRAVGVLTDDQIFAYQDEVWSRPDVAGYDELVDMSDVEHVAVPSIDRVVQLAAASAGMDPKTPVTRFASVAPRDFEFGLGRLYGARRELDGRGTKRVGVFRSRAEALEWLGLEKAPDETAGEAG